jgi:urease accessory protein
MSALPSTSSWQGHVELEFVHRHGKTEALLRRSQSPLRVQRAFYPEGPEICYTTLLHTAGGMVGGDRLALNFHLQSQTSALITTAAASKIYGSYGQSSLHLQGLMAEQVIQINLAEHSYLEWLPQETIVFDGALYNQRLRVELAAGASWLGWEITRFGRTARGEKFVSGNWRSHTEVWQNGRPLWIDPQGLKGDIQLFNSPHGLAGQPVVATLAWLGQPAPAELVTHLRHLWSARDRQGQAGVTALELGLLCRYRGPSSAEAYDWLIQVWQALRQHEQRRSPQPPRVWPSRPLPEIF